jgi:dTDP-4-dehydrorhamnose 3,5-epimerase
MAGSCKVLLDDGKSRETVVLKNKEECLLIENMTWIETSHYTEDCILLVLASEYYDDKDHIHDYTMFKEEVQSKS